LRQHVQKALNRGEDYHQLCRAISYVGFGKLRFKTEFDQQLWAECSRLIANCIIFYNASVLSPLLEHQEQTRDTQVAEATKKFALLPGSSSRASSSICVKLYGSVLYVMFYRQVLRVRRRT